MKNIYIDLDGTLIDSSAGIYEAYKISCKTYHLDPITENEFRTFIGPPIHSIISVLHPHIDDTILEKMVLCFREKYDLNLFNRYKWYEGVKEGILQSATKNNSCLHIVTNKPTRLAEKIISNSGLDGYFASIVGIDFLKESHNGIIFDSKAEAINCSLTRSGCNPKESVYIGDTIGDYRCSKVNGLEFIAILYGFYGWSHQELVGIKSLVSSTELGDYLAKILRQE